LKLGKWIVFQKRFLRKLNWLSSIVNFDFDSPDRKLIVFQSGYIDQIESSIIELHLGAKKIATEETYQTDCKENKNQKNYFGLCLL
jgi:hypothetical protein